MPKTEALVMTLGETIRTTREGQGRSLSWLAEECATSPSHISLIELDKKLPTVRTLTKIGKALGLDLRITFEPVIRKRGKRR